MALETEAPPFKCGHPRTPANTYSGGSRSASCRTCRTAMRKPFWLRLAKVRAGAR